MVVVYLQCFLTVIAIDVTTATNMFLKIVLWGLGFDGKLPNK